MENHEPQKYSAQWVSGKAEALGESILPHHACGGCGKWTAYLFGHPGEVYYKSACGCSWSLPQPTTTADVADWLRMQLSDEQRDAIMARLQPTNLAMFG